VIHFKQSSYLINGCAQNTCFTLILGITGVFATLQTEMLSM